MACHRILPKTGELKAWKHNLGITADNYHLGNIHGEKKGLAANLPALLINPNVWGYGRSMATTGEVQVSQ